MPLGRAVLPTSTLSALTPASTFSSLTSATFAVFDLMFNVQNTTSLLNLMFSSSLKHRCLRQLAVALFYSILFSFSSFSLQSRLLRLCAQRHNLLLCYLFHWAPLTTICYLYLVLLLQSLLRISQSGCVLGVLLLLVVGT